MLIFSSFLIWERTPSAQHCHRLEFKISKHFSEAGLRSGQTNNTDCVNWTSKDATEQKQFREWKQQQPLKWSMVSWYSFMMKRVHNINFLTLDSWLRDVVTQMAGVWLVHWDLTRPITLFPPPDQLFLWGLLADFTHIRPLWPCLFSLSVVRFCMRSGPDTLPFTSTSPLILSGNMTTGQTDWCSGCLRSKCLNSSLN